MQPCQTAKIMALMHRNQTGPQNRRGNPWVWKGLALPCSHSATTMGFLGNHLGPLESQTQRPYLSTDVSLLCGPARIHTAFPDKASGHNHRQVRWVSQQGDAEAGAGQGQSWRRSQRAPLCLAIHQDNVSSIVILLGLSADFQESGVTAEPALLGHQQQCWSSHPGAGAHILGYFSVQEFEAERDPHLSPSDPPCGTYHSDQQCLSVKPDPLQPCKT